MPATSTTCGSSRTAFMSANGDLVGNRAGAVAEMVGIDQVRTDGFDLGDNVVLADQRNGHDQHDAGAADDHAQHGQCGLYLVGSQCIDRYSPGFAADHYDSRKVYKSPKIAHSAANTTHALLRRASRLERAWSSPSIAVILPLLVIRNLNPMDYVRPRPGS